ncbi:MAG: glycosyltransferase family 4 protein, partial [Thermodesulfobacteriota bacterium]
LQSYDKKFDIFESYGVKPNFKITTTIPSTNTSARHFIHGTYSAFYTWFKRRNYDLILTRNIIYTYLSTLFFKIPTIYDAHHPLVNTAATYLFNSFKNSEYLVRFSTNSHGLGKIYTSLGLPEDKLVVAHNGVDLEGFQNVTTKLEAREQLNLPTQKKIVCYSGNIYSGRGVELLMDVAKRLVDVLFLIVGGLESDIENYRNIARMKKAENFKFVGFVPHKNVPIYLSSADVLVMPYTSRMTIQGGTAAVEFTSPIKLFEYMASCRPIVATALPTVKEILEDGRNALLIEPDSVDLLFYAIKKILEDPLLAEQLALQASSDARKYTWEERVKKILDGFF